MNVIEAAALLYTLPRGTDEAIKTAYRDAASRWHPDREGGDTHAMQRINAAKRYLLSMSREARMAEAAIHKFEADDIIDRVLEEYAKWEAWSVTNDESVTNIPKSQRKAAAWEARNRDKVREQTRERVARHRERNHEAYQEYMRDYMKKRRAAKAAEG